TSRCLITPLPITAVKGLALGFRLAPRPLGRACDSLTRLVYEARKGGRVRPLDPPLCSPLATERVQLPHEGAGVPTIRLGQRNYWKHPPACGKISGVAHAPESGRDGGAAPRVDRVLPA